MLEDYQKERVVSFWSSFTEPEHDMLGSGWHAYQSKVAIGSGGIWGKGFLQGTQNQYGFLPDQHSDFPFAVFAEEHGLLGVMLLLGAVLLPDHVGPEGRLRRPRTASARCSRWA